MGGKIFRTTPLDPVFWIASISFGLGTWLVGFALRKSPKEWTEKIKVTIDEDGMSEGDDIITYI